MPPYCYRCELGLKHPGCKLACGTTVEQAIFGADPELVSCVIVEPVMATAGCIVPPPGYLAKIREICDRYGVLLISDEVVCGFGRTGRWFGVDHFDVVPDIMVVAKGLTSGYAPMAAAIAGREIAEKPLHVFCNVHHVWRTSGVSRGSAPPISGSSSANAFENAATVLGLHDRPPRGSAEASDRW